MTLQECSVLLLSIFTTTFAHFYPYESPYYIRVEDSFPYRQHYRPQGPLFSNLYESNIVPGVIDHPPFNQAEVVYNMNGTLVRVGLGNLLPLEGVKNKPAFSWPSQPFGYYTLVMIDPDAPTPQDPALSQIYHFLVGNIQGDRVHEGEIFFDYISPAPPSGSAPHRYIVLVYAQYEKITFKESFVPSSSLDGRTNKDIRSFARKYNLIGPIAINYFYSKSGETTVTSQKETPAVSDSSAELIPVKVEIPEKLKDAEKDQSSAGTDVNLKLSELKNPDMESTTVMDEFVESTTNFEEFL